MSRQASPRPGTAPAETARPVILVADDSPETRRLLYFFLREEYDVVTVATAEEALAHVAEHPVDLVVMDINFVEGMNGIEATERLRGAAAHRDLPVLAVTAYAYPDDRARFLRAGFDDYLAKPLFRERMLKRVGALLAERGVWVSRKDGEGPEG